MKLVWSLSPSVGCSQGAKCPVNEVRPPNRGAINQFGKHKTQKQKLLSSNWGRG